MNATERMTHAEQGVAERYRANGYSVTLQPPPEMLPASVRSYRPDFVAVRGDERVAVEVKHGADIRANKQLLRIAEEFRRVPGWRFDLVVVGPNQESAVAPPLLTKRACAERLLSADRIAIEVRDYAAAVILLWTVFEAAIRAKTDEADRTRVLSPQRIAKEALSLGMITDREWEVLEQLAHVRNKAVHGERVVGVNRREFERARAIVSRLAESLDD